MKRREFMGYLAGGLAAATLDGKAGLLLARRRRISHSAYLLSRRIGISSWSFRNHFPSTRDKDYRGPGDTFALLDFPEMIADRYKVHHLELVAPHFAATNLVYLDELRTKLLRTRSYLVNLAIDIKEVRTGGGLSDSSVSVRNAAVEASMKWIDIAAHLRARSVRCDPGKVDPQNLTSTVDSYKRLVAYARRRGVRVIVENHDGMGSEHPEKLIKVLKSVNSAYFGVLPDFGNFPNARTRARGLKLFFPYATVVCHAKGLSLNARGNETDYNFPACVEIAKQERFRGVYSVELDGPGDPYSGVQDVINELLRYV